MRPFDAQAFLDSAGLQGTELVPQWGHRALAGSGVRGRDVPPVRGSHLSVLSERGKEAIVAVLGPATGLTVYLLLTMKPAAGGPGAAADVAVAAGA